MKKHALVWKKVKAMPVCSWNGTAEVTETILDVVAKGRMSPGEKQAEALNLRAKFIGDMSKDDVVYMEMGGVGDMAALLMYHRGIKVHRVPPKYLKDARPDTDKDNDHKIIQKMAIDHPDWFYPMTARDATIAELKEYVEKLYMFQRRIRIPMVLRLISIYRDEVLIDRVKAGQDISVVPTEEQIAEAALEKSEEDADLDSEELEETEETETETDEKPAKGKKKEKKKSNLSPEAAEIVNQLKKKLDNDPNLKKASETEKEMEKKIAALLPDVDVWNDVIHIDGIGPRIGGRLIAFLITPRRFEGKSDYHSFGNFSAYCGWTVDPEGRAQRMRRDTRLNYQPELKQALFNWFAGIFKRKSSPWRQWFDRLRESQTNGWDGKDYRNGNMRRYPGYAQKRTEDALNKPEMRKHFVEDTELRKRVNKAIKEVLGEDLAKQFKKNTEEVNGKLLAYLGDPDNRERCQKVWTALFDPDLWKSHIIKMTMRKLVKYLLMYFWHKWCRLEKMTFRPEIIEWVERELALAK